jgi:hypothetical protein
MQPTLDDVATIAENINSIADLIRPEFPKPFEETKWLVMS